MSVFLFDKKAGPLPRHFSIHKHDPSLNGKHSETFEKLFRLNANDFNRLFLNEYNLQYIGRYFKENGLNLRVLTHPYPTSTCFQKAHLLNWNPLDIIKTLYFEYSENRKLYALVIPETGCFVDKSKLIEIFELPGGYLKKAEVLPQNMTFGTCSPFIVNNDVYGNGKLKKIIFDCETLEVKKKDGQLDDFSFGLDHRMSIQMNYYNCYNLLMEMFPDIAGKKELLNLSFKEKFIRKNGSINICYNFHSLNYSTAKFINSIHGFGNVTIINDYIDELDLPGLLREDRHEMQY